MIEMNELVDLLKTMQEEKKLKLEEHRKYLNSEKYQAEFKNLKNLVWGFVEGLKTISLFSRREAEFRDNSLSLSHIDDYLMSVLSIMMMLQEGALNPAKREMRYMLDSSLHYLYTDQNLWRAKLTEKLEYFSRKVDSSNIKYIGLVDYHLFGKNADLELAFVTDYKKCYAWGCQYVHSSTEQIRERFELWEQGITIGLETAEQLRKVNGYLAKVLSIVLVFTFHAAGVSTTGDVMVEVMSPKDSWIFNGNKYIETIDTYYDYKSERKDILDNLISLRKNRAWSEE